MTIDNWNVILYGCILLSFNDQRTKEFRTHMKAINQGTNLSPAHSKMYKKTAKKGAPSTKAMAQPFNKSVTNNLGVVLLKPCFSSKTNVP